MLKKWIAICLSVVMIASMAMTATASDYSDLDGHWAEEYLLELADLGYLTGYTDGTMQPDGNITTTEALVLLSRLYNPPDAVLEEISNDYGATVAGILEPSLSWAYDEVEICLAAGIVSSSELSGLPMTSALEKELLSVLLIRTMQRVDDAKSNGTIMTFNDTDDITTAYQPYVAELVELGIINGDNNNNFDPHSSVTRAVVATMMVRALDVLDDDDITLEIPGYEGYRQIEGLVEEAGETDYTFQLRDVTGTLYEIRYDDETVITEGGDEVEMDEDLVGEYATVAFVSTGVSTITIEDNSYTEYWIQGMLSSFSPSGSGYTMYIKNLETSSSSQWIGTNTMTMTKNGDSTSTLSSGYFVTALVDSSGVVQVDAYTPDFDVTGTITTLTIGTIVDFAIKTDDGDTLIYPLSLVALPDLTQDGINIAIEQLSIGDEVTLTINDTKVTDIESHADFTTMTGTVSAMTVASSGNYWTITSDKGVDYQYFLSSSISILDQDGDYIDTDDINIKDYVSVRVSGSHILTVELLSSTGTSSSTVLGNILVVSESDQKITMYAEDGTLLYVDISDLGLIFDAIESKNLSISKLEEDDYIEVFGSYSDSSNFVATSIVRRG